MLVKKLKLALFLPLICTAGLAWSHGQAHDHGQAQDPMGEPANKTQRTIAIKMNDSMQYAPNIIQIKRGEAVTLAFKNEGRLKHEAIMGSLDELKQHAELMKTHPDMEHDDPKSISAMPGKTAQIKWKFTQAGTFHVGCLMPGHFDAGMRATIIVK